MFAVECDAQICLLKEVQQSFNLRGNGRWVKSFQEWSIKRILSCCSPEGGTERLAKAWPSGQPVSLTPRMCEWGSQWDSSPPGFRTQICHLITSCIHWGMSSSAVCQCRPSSSLSLSLSLMMDDRQGEVTSTHNNGCGISPAVTLSNRPKAALSWHEQVNFRLHNNLQWWSCWVLN